MAAYPATSLAAIAVSLAHQNTSTGTALFLELLPGSIFIIIPALMSDCISADK